MSASSSHIRDELSRPGSAQLSALRTVDTGVEGLQLLRQSLANGLSEPFTQAVETIAAASGRVIVTGVGKSGLVGAKIAATLASTGTPASFVHATEASHGDLGMITDQDVVLALSWSGETQELGPTIAYSRRFKVPLVALTSRKESALGSAADVVLALPLAREACPHGLAPTTSTLLQMALGDALAIALLEARGFTAQDFKVFHPGGRLGANLQYAHDIMHTGEKLPIARADVLMRDAIVLITQKGFGILGIVDEDDRLVGVITDGDLRRHLARDFLDKTAGEVMTSDPKTISGDTLVASVLEYVNNAKITSVFVAEDGKPIGIIHLHDLLRLGAA